MNCHRAAGNRRDETYLKELDHTLARVEVPHPGEVLPPEDADEEEDCGDRPGHHYHHNNLQHSLTDHLDQDALERQGLQ